MLSKRSHSCLFRFLLGIVFAALAATAFAEEEAYRLNAGDSITVTIYSHPRFSGVFVLDDRGRFDFPLIGSVDASGQTIEEIYVSITNRLIKQVDGKLELTVAIAEYRPVYIDGDVINPGAYAYRPGMTVSIAVTLAGGRQSVRSSGSLTGLSREQEQFETLLDNYRIFVAREARLLAEMSGKKRISFPEDLETAAKTSVRVREVLDNERAIMASSSRLQAIQTNTLRQRIEGLEQVIGELESQKKIITSRHKLYEQQFADIRKVAKQGAVPKTALLRLQITATTLDQEMRAAEITLIQTRQSLKEARMKLENLPIERRASNAATLQEVQDGLAKSRIQFDQSIRRLASLHSQAPPELAPKVSEQTASIIISRVAGSNAGTPTALPADWNSSVLPGDVIRIPYPEFSAPDAFGNGLPRRVKSSQN